MLECQTTRLLCRTLVFSASIINGRGQIVLDCRWNKQYKVQPARTRRYPEAQMQLAKLSLFCLLMTLAFEVVSPSASPTIEKYSEIILYNQEHD